MSAPCYIIDAFTDRAFAGNPAAVVVLGSGFSSGNQTESWPEDLWLQQVAAEFNLSETAFLLPGLASQPGNHFRLRWFTPATEVELCGHATLASSLALWAGQGVSEDTLHFHTLSGELTTQRQQQAIVLDFPIRPITPRDDLDRVRATLGDDVITVANAGANLLVEFAHEESVRRFPADMAVIKQLSDSAVSITAQSHGGRVDFVSRFFAPLKGIDEDPVTGSAHCGLANYWSQKLGKNELRAEQVSPRGGRLDITVRGNRVALSGQGKMIMQGQLLVSSTPQNL